MKKAVGAALAVSATLIAAFGPEREPVLANPIYTDPFNNKPAAADTAGVIKTLDPLPKSEVIPPPMNNQEFNDPKPVLASPILKPDDADTAGVIKTLDPLPKSEVIPPPMNNQEFNDPSSPDYRGYHADVGKNEDGRATTLDMIGNIPYRDRFNAFGEYDLEVIEPQSPTAMLGPEGYMMEANIKRGNEIVGHASIYYFQQWYTDETGRQSYVVGRFNR